MSVLPTSLLGRPLVGILVTGKIIRRLLNQQPTKKLNLLITASKETAVPVYFFSIRSVDCKRKRISGVYFDGHQERWQKMNVPFPDVLYNRCSIGLEKRKYRNIRRIMRQEGVQRLNARDSLDKWETYVCLERNPRLRRYLPTASLMYAMDDVDSMLSAYPIIYLKKRSGRQGRAIVRLERTVNSGGTRLIQCSYYGKRLVRRKLHSKYALRSFLRSHYRNMVKTKKIVIQQGINVLQRAGQRVDMRAELQRDGDGRLRMMGITVRMVPISSPISNLRSDPQILSFDQFLEDVWVADNRMRKLKKEVHRFLYRTYRTIERSHGTFGEMAIDFAIDENDRIWWLECNATPAKNGLLKTGKDSAIREYFRHPLAYARFMYERKRH